MYPSVFRERIYQLTKEVMDKNPPSLTGYFDSPSHLKQEMLEKAPDVALNGQRSSSLWSTFNSGDAVKTVFRVKDPTGGKQAVGFHTYRINGLLIAGNTGKLVSMAGEPGEEMILGDAMFQGSRFAGPTIVSVTNLGQPPDSVVAGTREQESGAPAPLQGDIGGFEPVDPMTGQQGTQVTEEPGLNRGAFGIPLPKFSDLDPATGKEYIQPDPKDARTPWGTNARTGTTAIGPTEMVQPSLPANAGSGWSLNGQPSFLQDLGKIIPKF